MPAVGTPFLELVAGLLLSVVPFARVQGNLNWSSAALGALGGYGGLFSSPLPSHPPMPAVGMPFLELVAGLLLSDVSFARVRGDLHWSSAALGAIGGSGTYLVIVWRRSVSRILGFF